MLRSCLIAVWFVLDTFSVGAAFAQTAYITNNGAHSLSEISTTTNSVSKTVELGNSSGTGYGPYGVAVSPDGSKVYIANMTGSVTVLDTASNTVSKYIALSNAANPYGVAISPDGSKVYVTSQSTNTVSVIATASNTVTATIALSGSNYPTGVAVSPDGSKVYVAVQSPGKVVVISTATNAVTGSISIANSSPLGIAFTPNGAKAYVTGTSAGSITVIAAATDTVSKTIYLAAGSAPKGVAVTPDGSKVYVANDSGSVNVISTATDAVVSTIGVGMQPFGIAVTPDGSKIFVANSGSNNVSVISTSYNTVAATIAVGLNPVAFGQFIIPAVAGPVVSPDLLAATLPSSRSIQVGKTATAFATILNAGSSAAGGCGIAPSTAVPAGFSFQTTNSQTNALTGSANTRVSIPPGAAQSYVVAFTATGPLAPTNVRLNFGCTGFSAATYVGVNTLALTFDVNPVPDMIAIGLTPSNDGFSRTGGNTGTGLFVIATSNIGSPAALTARARLSDTTLPLSATVCKTDPVTAQCLAAPSSATTATVGSNSNDTWAAFITANGAVSADPANNRVFFEFIDTNGVLRGSTSTAITTQ